jgi:VanZ family protein
MIRVWWVLGILLVCVALVVCLMPMPQMNQPFNFNDKIAHGVGHAGLAMYFSGLVERRRWWKLFAFLLLFGVLIEFAQHYMNVGRDGDVRDVIFNALGSLTGLLAGHLGVSRWPVWISWMLGKRAVP